MYHDTYEFCPLYFGGTTNGFLFSTASSFSFRMDGLTGLDEFVSSYIFREGGREWVVGADRGIGG